MGILRNLTAQTLSVSLLIAFGGCGDDDDSAQQGGDSLETPASQNPSPSARSPEPGLDPELIRRSEAVDAAIRPLFDFVDGGGEGFARVRVENAALAAEIQWKKPVPVEVKSLQGETDSGVRITVTSVPFSQADVDAAAEAIQSAVQDDRIPGIERISANKSFTGLLVGFTEGDFGRYGSDSSLREKFERVASMPVTFVKVGAIVSLVGPTPSSTPSD